jgi:TetR/AcrR family transcriptional repressor of nem operon
MDRTRTDTKQKLIDTALALMWTSSYGWVSVDDICKAARVKKGSFYHFFPSKVGLAIAAMEEAYQSSKPLYDGMFSPTTAPVKRFEKLADYIYQGQLQSVAKYGRVCGCPLASLGSEVASREAGVRAKFEEISRRHRCYFETALRDMVADDTLPETTDVKVKAEEVSAYLLGQVMMARIRNDLKALKRDLKPGLLRTLGVANKAVAVA